MAAEDMVLFGIACDKVDRGSIDEARKLLAGNPDLATRLEMKIRPPDDVGRFLELKRLAQLASFHRGRAWIYQLEATQVCHYSRTLLKDPLGWLTDFLDRQGLTYQQRVTLHSQFFDLYHEELKSVREIVYNNWAGYKKERPKGVRFKDYTQFKSMPAPQEFPQPPKVLSRYERPWVI